MKRFLLVLMVLCLMIPGLCASAEQTANGLTITGTLELEYATQFRVDFCEGGYNLITNSDGARFLTVPEGAEAPEGIDDDIVLLHGNKRELHDMRRAIEDRLRNCYHLAIKPDWQVFRVDGRGVDFLGYRFFHGHTVIRKRTAYRIARKIREIGTHVRCSLSDASSVMSYLGITTHCDSYNFMRHYVLPFISIAYCKEVHREACKAIAS